MRYSTIRTFVMLGVLLLATHYSMAGDVDVNAFISAQQTFERSLSGDKEQTELAIAQFQKLVDDNHTHPLLLAYLGSAYTLKARDSFWPWTSLSNAEKGLEIIDKALSLLGPEHDDQFLRGSLVTSETYLVAISTFIQVPSFLNRMQAAKDLLSEILNAPIYVKSAPEVKGRLQLWAAEIARKKGDIDAQRAHLKLALELLPPGRYLDDAKGKIRQLSP